jgi:hypothetical protein
MAEGRMDAAEYATRMTALGPGAGDAHLAADVGRRALAHPLVIAAVLLAALSLVALVASVSPLASGFHPAFLWIVPLVGFKIARFHGHRSYRSSRQQRGDEGIISV